MIILTHSVKFLIKASAVTVTTVFVIIVAIGCRPYKPMPLSRESVDQALTPPSESAVRVEAASLKHPILPPVAFDLKNGLSPDEAAVLAVLANPELRAARDRRGLADAQVMQAKLLPNPQLSLGLDFPTGGQDQGTVTGYGLGLSWDVSALIARAAREKSAGAEREAVELDVAWQEWQTAEAAKLSVYKLHALELEISLARENDRDQAENLRLVRSGFEAGQATSIESSSAREAADAARSMLIDLEGEERHERLELNRLLGLAPETRVELEQGIELPSRFDPLDADSLLAGLEERRLDLLALKKGYESQEQNLRAAVLGQFPPVNVGVNQARDTGDVISTGFSVDIDLPIFDRNQAQIAIEKAGRQELFDEYVSRVADARLDVAGILSEAKAMNDRIETGREALDDLDSLAAAYKTAFGEGRADAYDYYGASASAFEKRVEIIALEEQLMETRIALELATGLYRIEETR